MIVRKLVRCLACSQDYILRYGVGLGFEQRLGWPCPLCDAETRAHFSVKQKVVDADFKSDDIEIYQHQPSDLSLPGVNVYSDLPVHMSSIGRGLIDGGSAWLAIRKFIQSEKYSDFVDAKESMQDLRVHIFPMIRRSTGHYKRDNWVRLHSQLIPFTKEIPNLSDRHPVYGYSRLLDVAFLPILNVNVKVLALQEVFDLMNFSYQNHSTEYGQFVTDAFSSQRFRDARGRCLDTMMRLFDVYDALILPLATQSFSNDWRARLDEFRVYRDDFDLLKSIYQDIFESMNQLLLWIGLLVNIGKRGALNTWSNGSNKTFRQAQRWRAIDREFIISELPNCETLLSEASRDLRNKIGHYSVHHDILSGRLIFGDGTSKSLITFHEDLLAAARLLSVLIGFCEKMTLDHERIIVGTAMTGWMSE